MVIICMGTTLGTSVLFAYCYFGKSATESYEKMAGCLYLWDWHELSPKLQKHLLVMMINAQRPIYYHGFGVANLDLEKFTDVSKNWSKCLIRINLFIYFPFVDEPSGVFVLHDVQDFNSWLSISKLKLNFSSLK